MACNSAVVGPTNKCLPPSCSSCDPASDEIVFITQSLKIKNGRWSVPNGKQFQTSSDPVLYAGVIHPKVNLYIYVE